MPMCFVILTMNSGFQLIYAGTTAYEKSINKPY